MQNLLNKPALAHKRITRNKAVITAAILRFSEMDLINGNVVSHEDAIKSFERILRV